ncbi:hypothetical protein [Spiroplasma floricola]|uniref:Uncharacterized protein n=1 Tax=Spiroplasma floricola 23-6 TaxID=1336749 RepID=A0A2K8SEH7_9MOLU|nr:hypothetical protein [Spiroplasma floricola]AUB31832.1 hypothetical protein SFLOR_v1c07840 [Spiroplasma floricola 23-6]
MSRYWNNNNFWINVGSHNIFNCLKFIGDEHSFEEILNATKLKIVNKTEDKTDIKNRNLTMLIDAWLEVKRIILEKKSEMKKNKSSYPHCKVFDYKELYLILNKDARVYDLFLIENKREDNDVYMALSGILKKVQTLKNYQEIILEFSIFLHENYVKGTFGSNTKLFCWFLLQMVLIFKGFGPIITLPENYIEMAEIISISNSLNEEILHLKQREWIEGENFKKLTNLWILKSEEYLKHIKKNYA